MAPRFVKAVITAENQFTDPVTINQHGTATISGTFTGTITLQRSADGGLTYLDTGDSWVGAGSAVSHVVPITDTTNQQYRIGAKTSGWTSGSADVWLGSSNA